MKRLLFVFGTRPEAIKLAPLILAAQARPGDFAVRLCATAQHRQMLDQVLQIFGLVPDDDLDLMRPGQTLAGLTARVVEGVDAVLQASRPDMMVVQGDTTTVMAGSLAAFYRRVPVAHVEAGLRTHRMDAPFPEEMNRVVTSHIAALHFAPTAAARANLLREGIKDETIHVTGNTVIDALFLALERVRQAPPAIPGLSAADLASEARRVLVTGHRRENFGEGFEAICRALLRLAQLFPDVLYIYPVHLNPNVREPVTRLLGHQANIRLIAPLDYLPFVRLMSLSEIILTDSGGVQEEAPSLGKPVLVMRETTERPEAVEAGTVRLVGTDENLIVSEAARLLGDPAARVAMSQAHNPYGDGHASPRILDAIGETLRTG